MPKTAGMESAASVTSVISTTSRTRKQWCREQPARDANEKMLTMIFVAYTKTPAGEAEQPALLR